MLRQRPGEPASREGMPVAGNGVNAAALREFVELLAAPPPCLALGERAVVEPCLLTVLAAMLSADVVVFNDMAPRHGLQWAESVSFGYFSRSDDPADYEDREGGEDPEFFEVFWSDPCSQPERTGDVESVTTLSDFRSVREWHRSQMYDRFREYDVPLFDRMIMLPLPAPPGRSRRVRFLRESGRDFDDTDRAVATLIRPHLVAHLHDLDLAHRGIPPLTRRQRHLMALVAQGYTNIQAGRTLGISPQTVRTHLQQIYSRLGVNSRGEAVALLGSPSAGVPAQAAPLGRAWPSASSPRSPVRDHFHDALHDWTAPPSTLMP